MIGRHVGSIDLFAKFCLVFLEYRLHPGVVTQVIGGRMMKVMNDLASALFQSSRGLSRTVQLQCIMDSSIGHSFL